MKITVHGPCGDGLPRRLAQHSGVQYIGVEDSQVLLPFPAPNISPHSIVTSRWDKNPFAERRAPHPRQDQMSRPTSLAYGASLLTTQLFGASRSTFRGITRRRLSRVKGMRKLKPRESISSLGIRATLRKRSLARIARRSSAYASARWMYTKQVRWNHICYEPPQ